MNVLDDFPRSRHYDTDPLWEIARTGKYRGHTANIGWMFARRDNGWNGTSALQDVCHFQETTWLGSGQNFSGDMHYLAFPAGASLKFSAIPGAAAAGNRCEASMHFIIVSDT